MPTMSPSALAPTSTHHQPADPQHTEVQEPSPAIGPVFSGGWWRNAVLWRTLTLGGLLAVLLGVGAGASLYEMMNSHITNLSERLSKVRHVSQVAVLTGQGGQSGQAAWLITLESHPSPLKVQRLAAQQAPADSALQLWAVTGGAVRSLGVLGTGQGVQRLNIQAAELKGADALQISQEPAAGNPSSTGPTGPVLFKGALIPNL